MNEERELTVTGTPYCKKEHLNLISINESVLLVQSPEGTVRLHLPDYGIDQQQQIVRPLRHEDTYLAVCERLIEQRSG